MKTNNTNKKDTNLLSHLNLNTVLHTFMHELMDWEMAAPDFTLDLDRHIDDFRTAEQWKNLYLLAKEAEEYGLIFWTVAINYDFVKLVEFMKNNDDNNNWFSHARDWFRKHINLKHEHGIWWVSVDEREVFTARANLRTKRATFKFSHKI